MRTIHCPSKTFVAECNAAIEINESMTIAVPLTCRKRKAVLRSVEEINGTRPASLVQAVLDKIWVLDFWQGIASAHVRNWQFDAVVSDAVFVFVQPRPTAPPKRG